MPTQTVISINRQTPIMGPATFYPRVVVKRLPLTDDERKALIREEMERLLGPDAVYCMYFGDEDTNGIMPINDIDEYKTEYSPIKSVSISGKPGGVLEASLSVSGPSDQTYYLGWTYTDAGGPSVSKGISFAHPFKFITVSLSLGMVSNTDNYGIEFGINDAKPGVKYKVTEVAQFASTDCPFRMNGAGSSVEAV